VVSLLVEGRWSLRALGDEDIRHAIAFLQRDPLVNVYLISRLIEERSAAATQIYVVRHNREIVLLASLATNIVLAADPEEKPDIIDAAIAMIGRVSHSRHRSPRLHHPAPRRTMPGTMRMTPRPKAPTVPLFSTRMASPAVAAAVAAVAAVAIAVKMARA